MTQNNPAAGDPRSGLIHTLSGWISAITAVFLMLENWGSMREGVYSYLNGHVPEYSDLLILAAPFVIGLVVHLTIHLLLSTVLQKIYFVIGGL